MSGAPKHVQRDGHYIDLDDSAKIAWSADTPNATQTITVNAKTAVEPDFNFVSSQSHVVKVIAASNRCCIGCYMQAPVGDRVPYRVKAKAAAASGHLEYAIVVGYGPAAITGAGDVIDEPHYFPFAKEFDDLIIVNEEEPGDTYENRALFFGVMVQGSSAGTGDYFRAELSVQSLGVKPPTMQNAIS